jgi:hypothetical protein
MDLEDFSEEFEDDGDNDSDEVSRKVHKVIDALMPRKNEEVLRTIYHNYDEGIFGEMMPLGNSQGRFRVQLRSQDSFQTYQFQLNF